MTLRTIITGADFSASATRRSERLIVGGLSSNAGIVSTASIVNGSTTMTILSVAAGRVAVGQTVNMLGVPAGTTITALGTSTGGAGTVTLSAAATATATDTVQTHSRTGLVGEYLFGRNAATSRFNLCGGPNLTFNGSPVFDKRFATFSQNAWADTGLPDTQELTMLIVCAEAGASAALMTSYNGSNPADCVGMHWTGGQISAFINNSDGTQTTANGPGRTPTTDFTIKVIRTTGTVNYTIKVDEFRGGVRVGGVTSTPTKTRKVTASAIAIGSARGASAFAGLSYSAGAAIFSRCLTDQELPVLCGAISTNMGAWPQQAIVC